MKTKMVALTTLVCATLASANPPSGKFEHCEKLASPLVYKNTQNGQFLLAVDSCMKSFFEGTGMSQSQFSPPNWGFANVVSLRGSMASNGWFYDLTSKTIYEVSDENNVEDSIVAGLGFQEGQPKDPSGYVQSSDDLILHLWVGCNSNTKTLESMAQLRSENNDNPEFADRVGACQSGVILPPVSVQDQIETQRKAAEDLVSSMSNSLIRAQAQYVESGKFCGKKGPAFQIELQVKTPAQSNKSAPSWKKIKTYEILASDLEQGDSALFDLDTCTPADDGN